MTGKTDTITDGIELLIFLKTPEQAQVGGNAEAIVLSMCALSEQQDEQWQYYRVQSFQ